MNGAERLEARLRAAGREGRAALLPYLVAGFPRRAAFGELLVEVGGADARPDGNDAGGRHDKLVCDLDLLHGHAP
ncbi:MAG: hypothetical protein ABL998_19570, partial [Planctomycetota bacterium]